MRRRGLRLVALAAIPALAFGACNATSPTPTAAPATPTPAPPAGAASGTGRWFVGLDSLGTQTAQVAAEKAFVANYDAVNRDGITIKLEIVPSVAAADVLKTEMAAGNAPDIVGPVGVKGLDGFDGLLLDLTSEIHKNNVELTAYESSVVKFFQGGDIGQIGLPYDITPGYIWYDKDAFTKANLPPLPTTVGEQYQGQTWDWNELAKVAAQLTLDKSGKKSTDHGFDPKNIVQYGMDFQGADARRVASLFGAGSFVATDGKTAQIPALWNDAYTWYYDAVWKGHYVPSGAVESSALLAGGNSQSSGRVAMNAAWGSSIMSIAADAKTSKVKNWDVAVIPSWKGTTTSPMDADAFTITKASKNPDAAFKAMLAIMADATLLKVYGREPAKTADQAAYFTALDATLAPVFPGNEVTWDVLGEMEKLPAVPSPDSNMPAFDQAYSDIGSFFTKLQTTEGLDVNGELTKLQKVLQTDFDAVQPLLSQ